MEDRNISPSDRDDKRIAKSSQADKFKFGYEPRSPPMSAYSWTGNLRELRNAIERAVIPGAGPDVGLGGLPERIGRVGSGLA